MGSFKQQKDFFKIQMKLQKLQTKEYLFLQRRRRKIKRYYQFLSENYLKVLEYLINDFNLTNMTVTTKRENISFKKEIEDTTFYIDKINSQIMNMRAKYYAFRVLYLYYPQVLKLLKSSSKQDLYKDINFKEHFDYLQEMENSCKYFSL